MAAATPPQKFLLRVPISVRHHIYSFVLKARDVVEINFLASATPALTRTCRELRAQALDFWINQNTFAYITIDFDVRRLASWSRIIRAARLPRQVTQTAAPNYILNIVPRAELIWFPWTISKRDSYRNLRNWAYEYVTSADLPFKFPSLNGVDGFPVSDHQFGLYVVFWIEMRDMINRFGTLVGDFDAKEVEKAIDRAVRQSGLCVQWYGW